MAVISVVGWQASLTPSASAAPVSINLCNGTDKPMCLSWLSPPPGILQRFARQGVVVFDEHARVVRAAGHIARHAEDLRQRIRHRPERATPFRWGDFIEAAGRQVVSGDPHRPA